MTALWPALAVAQERTTEPSHPRASQPRAGASLPHTKGSLIHHPAPFLILKGLSELAVQVLESITGFFEVGCLFFLQHICYSFYLDLKMQCFGLSCEREVSVLKSLRWWFSSVRLSPSTHLLFYSFGDDFTDPSSGPKIVLATQETAANKMKSLLLRYSLWKRHTNSEYWYKGHFYSLGVHECCGQHGWVGTGSRGETTVEEGLFGRVAWVQIQ